MSFDGVNIYKYHPFNVTDANIYEKKTTKDAGGIYINTLFR